MNDRALAWPVAPFQSRRLQDFNGSCFQQIFQLSRIPREEHPGAPFVIFGREGRPLGPVQFVDSGTQP